ncbi:porin [Escherichia coli]|nr:porin [Escherichia coli]EEW0864994.1 porin [Escherichia coli]EEY1449992.1 porin [Escherichia coli]EFE0748608.1 porin [Escherichia coli]EFE0768271.1 porin [Escherichia coli]
MRKLSMVVCSVVSALMLCEATQAAEIYNKDGNKLDFYGRVKARHYISDGSMDGDRTFARLGFKGETQINESLTGFGQWEYQFLGFKTESEVRNDKNRLAFAGIRHNILGSLDYGRNYGVAYDVGALTDVLPDFGGDSWTYSDNYMTGRTTGVLTWRNTDFFGLVDGLTFSAQYQGKNDRDNLLEANGDGYGFSVSYDYEGFGIVAAYTNADRTSLQEKEGRKRFMTSKDSEGKEVITPRWIAGGKHAEFAGIGVKYNDNDLYLAADYSETRNMTPFGSAGIADKARNIEVVAQYMFDFGLRPSLAYVQSRGMDVKGGIVNYGDQSLVEYIDVGANYFLNKNMSLLIDYKINLIDESEFTQKAGVATDNIIAVGMMYQF